MNSTLAVIINIPLLFLVYIMIFFTQSLSGKRQFYGVSLNSDYFAKKEFKALDKKFKLLVTIGFVVFTIITSICIYIFKAYITSSIVPILGFCVYEFFAFLHVHNKVKALKEDLSLEISDLELEKTKVILDTDFINEKNRIIKKYSLLSMIPFVITVLVGIYAITQYNSMPDIIPSHWGFSGEPDAFSEKSFMSVFGVIIMSVGVGLIITISSIYSLKSRVKLNPDNLNESKKANLNYLNKIALTFFIVSLGCQILFINILIATVNASSVNNAILFPTAIAIIIAAFYQTYLYYKSPSKSKTAVYSVDDNDNNWIFGTLYNNPNDPSLFVQKRFGVGWTVNIGSTKGKIVFISPFILIIFILIIAFYI
ncbi:DUF1648 domain-containing protein [Terrisporobacter sp.]|uniref:DUF1648 domain-containing protein n=1 Tax=Terrisporobacter sp. TaxID=1965305 RepID=UPI00261A3378|nr:DUF1648 domain-containing protein [Terrisporobacter sp.]